jgi:arylsulfatase A-like enzyme
MNFKVNTPPFIILCTSLSINAQKVPDKPNIILIQVDQMRPDHLSKMPELMKLANDGVIFENAYTASPLSQPSRTSIITGLYPSKTGIYGNQTGPISENLRENTFMNKLQDLGYYTALIGKHHYIDRWAVGIDVVEKDKEEIKKYGFDYVIQCLDILEHFPNQDKTENVDDYINHLIDENLYNTYVNEYDEATRHAFHPLSSRNTEDGFIGSKAEEFIFKYDNEAPFYLNVSFIGPHPPYVISEEFKKTLPEKTINPILAIPDNNLQKRRAVYVDMCRHIDSYIGKIVKALDEKKLLENTVIIFISDHGDNLGDYGIWDKRYFYEQSVGIPMVIYGSGIAGRNARFGSIRSKALVSTLDIYPTILSVAGIDISISNSNRPGRNLIEIANGVQSVFRNAVYSELGTSVMVRTAKWKMVYDPEQGGTCYLYNLISDPNEKNNLTGVAGYGNITSELTNLLLSRYITSFQSTQTKEQLRLQKVRVQYIE